MDPTVRSARTKSAIIMATARTAILLPRIPDLQPAERSFAPSKSSCQERNFWMQRPEAKNRLWTPLMCTETESPVTIPAKSAQKRPLFDRGRFPRFVKTGWWRMQSLANRSPTWISRVTGNYQGISVFLRPRWAISTSKEAENQSVRSEFPDPHKQGISAEGSGNVSFGIREATDRSGKPNGLY